MTACFASLRDLAHDANRERGLGDNVDGSYRAECVDNLFRVVKDTRDGPISILGLMSHRAVDLFLCGLVRGIREGKEAG